MNADQQALPSAVIIFSGFNQRSVIALCRTLDVCKIEFFIVAHSARDTIFLTTYRARVARTRSREDLDLEDICVCISEVSGHGKTSLLVAPTSESMNLFLLTHRKRIESAGGIVPLVDIETYRMVSDKGTFTTLCAEHGIPVPAKIDWPEFTPELPIVAKSVTETTQEGRRIYPLLIHSVDEWQRFCKSPDQDYYFLQRFINGPSYYLLYYRHRSGEIDRFSMQNLVQQPDGKSMVAAEPAKIHCDPVFSGFDTLLEKIGFHGLIMIEIMFEGSDWFVIEANPRMWGPAQLMVDAGVNLYISLLNDYFEPTEPLDTTRISGEALYFWQAGFQCHLADDKLKWHRDPESFWSRYGTFVNSEVYARPDSREIFLAETAHLSSTSLPVSKTTPS